MEVIIDRNTWIRGEGGNYSFLVRGHDKHKCCLGFCAIVKGIPEKSLMGAKIPAELSHYDDKSKMGWLASRGDAVSVAMALNDMAVGNSFELGIIPYFNIKGVGEKDTTLQSETQREEMIAKIFADNGDTVTYIN